MENLFLSFAQKIQAIAQTGLTYSQNQFDIERYEQLRSLSFDMMEALSNTPIQKITDLFEHEKGYQTPKIDIRGVIFRNDTILMVQEKTDSLWSLPGGWGDIGLTPKEVVVKEVREESGLIVEPVRLLAILDKKCHPHPPSPWYSYKIFILCKETGGNLKPGMETTDTKFFALKELPPLSIERITTNQIETMFDFKNNPQNEAICD